MRLSHLGRHVLIVGFLLALGPATDAQVAPSSPAATARLADARDVSVGSDGSTPLHQAVRQNDLKTVDALIKSGADVKAATRYGVTPMHVAATQRQRGDPAPAARAPAPT